MSFQMTGLLLSNSLCSDKLVKDLHTKLLHFSARRTRHVIRTEQIFPEGESFFETRDFIELKPIRKSDGCNCVAYIAKLLNAPLVWVNPGYRFESKLFQIRSLFLQGSSMSSFVILKALEWKMFKQIVQKRQTSASRHSGRSI